MPLIIPQLDDRSSYSDILDEALARIGVHNPEWTNFNDSDPGVTLLQLFSFMNESLLYRANLIPERNRLKFLTLLGITPRPATAARGVVTVTNDRGPMQAITLPANLPLMAGKVGFVTQNGLDVLPIEMQAYLRQPPTPDKLASAQQMYGQLYATYTNDPTDLDFYEVVPFDPPASAASISSSVSLSNDTDTVDGCLWLALLTRSSESAQADAVLNEIRGRVLTLGIMPAIEDASRILFPGVTAAATQGQPKLQYSIATGATSGGQFYTDLEPREDNNPLQDLTLVQLPIPTTADIGKWDQLAPLEDGVGDYPPTIDDPNVAARLLTWIRIRLQQTGGVTSTLNAKLSWVGINATRVTQQSQVIGEPLGLGTGEPDQTVQLVNTPVIPQSVQLAVNGELWTRIDDLLAAPPEVQVRDPSLPPGASLPPSPYPSPKVFTVDGESGQIQFGNGLHGARPVANGPIVASYAYGGGAAGNVGIGAIQSSPQLPAGFTVKNPLPTWGGDQGESVSDAERNIPGYLRNGRRAVSASDFVDIVQQTPGIDLGRVEVVPLFNPDADNVNSPGTITVMVIPNGSDAPEPDRLFLDAVCTYLEPRRLVTTEVYVRGPKYVDLYVSLGIDVIAGRDIAVVRDAVRQKIRQYLSPLPQKTGWLLSKTVDPTGVLVQALQVDGVSNVRQVLLWDDKKAAITQLPISGLQLPRLKQLVVTAGDAQDLTTVEAPPARPRLPVPLLPPEC